MEYLNSAEIDKFKYDAFYTTVQYFVDRGYQRGKTIRAAPYDWRLAAGTVYTTSINIIIHNGISEYILLTIQNNFWGDVVYVFPSQMSLRREDTTISSSL